MALAADCQRTVKTAVELFGRLDIVFNNAGIIRRADVIGTTEDEWDRVMDVNVKSIFLMSKYAVPEIDQGRAAARSSTRARAGA